MHAVIHRRHLLVTVALSSLLVLAGCKTPEGYGPRSTMSVEDASADRLEQFSRLVAGSDAAGLDAEFSDAARENSAGLSDRVADLMSVLGGGTVSNGEFYMSVGTLRGGEIYVVSSATVTAPDGSVWQLHVTDCTLNRDDPSELGIKAIEVIPDSGHDAPQGFGWFNESSGAIRYGVRLITSWDGWDPHTSPYSPDW